MSLLSSMHQRTKFMEDSLELCKKLRPQMSWGYYGFPRRYNLSDQLSWLWNASTGIYPSIYLKSISRPESDYIPYVQSILTAAIRVVANYGVPGTPIVSYSNIQATSKEFLSERNLSHVLGLPAEMGMDAALIWGSSRNFHPNPYDRCKDIQRYVHSTLGPYVQRLTRRMAACSEELCGGRGRCVGKAYAKTYGVKYGSARGVDQGTGEPGGLSNATLEEFTAKNNKRRQFAKTYVCQCYQGWSGRHCGSVATD